MKVFSGRLVRHSATPFGVVAQHRRRHGHGLVLCGFAVVGTWDLGPALFFRDEKRGERERKGREGRGREGRGEGRAEETPRLQCS